MFEIFYIENKIRPLIENFRWKISIKNGLRPSSVSFSDSFPPRGSRNIRRNFKLTSIVGGADTFPEGESKGGGNALKGKARDYSSSKAPVYN